MKAFCESRLNFRLFFPRLLIFDIAFKIVSVAILVPFATWVLSELIASTGNLVIGNTDTAKFALSPAGILLIVVGGALLFTSCFLEQTGLIAIGSGQLQGKAVSVPQAIGLAVRHLPSLVAMALLQMVIYLIVALPFLAVGAFAYFYLLGDHDINYYLASKPPIFWVTVVVVGAVVIALVVVLVHLYLNWLFSVPAVIFEGKSFSAALKRSDSLMKGNFRRSAVIIAWAIGMFVVTALVMTVITALSQAILSGLWDNLSLLAVASALTATVILVVIAALDFVRRAINSLLILNLYADQCERDGTGFAKLPEGALSGGQPLPSRRLIVGIALLVLVIGVIAALLIMNGLVINTDVQVTAHRGNAVVAPENTLIAIEKSIEVGADLAEIDVQETKDGVVVLLHDSDLMRVAGVPKNIWDVTYDEIKDLDAGSWYSTEFADERILTLDEVTAVTKDKIDLMLELKYYGHQVELEERVVDALRRNDFGDQTVMQSLDYDGLMRFKALDPDIPVGYTLAAALGNLSGNDADFLSLSSSIATPGQIELAHEHGKGVAVWTIDDRNEMVSVMLQGADNIITNEPELLVAVREEMSQLSSAEKVLLAFSDWLRRL